MHSPLLGPGSWSAVAQILRAEGEHVDVPDLGPALIAGHDFAERQAALAAQAPDTGPLVVAAHSAAGPLLPSIVRALRERGIEVTRCLLVDARLPLPGRSRRSALPAEFAAHLDSLTVDGMLPPWPQWWPSDALEELLPDVQLRAALAEDCRPLPVAFYDEPMPVDADLPPTGYLMLSEPYADAAAEAESAGWAVARLAADHLALLTRPGELTAAMRELADRTSALADAGRRHVARFNRAVHDGDWASFAAAFAEDATMSFTNVPVGPFHGRQAIEQAYYAQPPDDTMTIREIEGIQPDTTIVSFVWDANGPGTMTLHWAAGLVQELVITFG